MKADLSTPEVALAALEDAYNRKDVDAAVGAKDFTFEAREMLISFKNLPNPPDEYLVKQTAQPQAERAKIGTPSQRRLLRPQRLYWFPI